MEDRLDGSQFEFVAEPEMGQSSESPESRLETLEQIASTDLLKRETLDVRYMLEAQVAASNQKTSESVQYWFRAMKLAQGRFAKYMFEGWVKAYATQLNTKLDRTVLARLILAETRSGRVSRFLMSKNLLNESSLVPILEQIIPEAITSDDSGKAAAREMGPPVDFGIPKTDPLLTKTAASNCESSRLNLNNWQIWQNSLSEDVRSYWHGLILQCSDQGSKALEVLRNVYLKLAKNKDTQGLAVEAASRTAGLERALDQKASAADTYSSLMVLYALPGVSSASMGLSSYLFLIRRIEDTLWASRYRATVGDYENGKRFSQTALELINIAATDPEAQTAQRREELANLRAESLHILAYRIAVEKQQYESAAAMMILAQQSQYLNRKWSERLQWFAGLYEFLAGNMQSSRERWIRLINSTDDGAMRSMVKFWVALSFQKMGDDAAAAEAVDSLISEFPLSYYSVVATQYSELKARVNWRQRFADPAKLAEKLRSRRKYNLRPLLHDKYLKSLLIRAQILTETRMLDLAKVALGELEAAMLARLDISRDTDAFIYLSRLHYHIGQFLSCISLTTKMARSNKNFWHDHPEQIFVYFPAPYLDSYTQSALETSLDKTLLLSISRQESGFTSDIRSSAGATGIMQLIRPTAKRYAADLMSSDRTLDDLLTNPRANIRIGARFLQHLKVTFKGFGPAIYGGYNAGEYAMKTWLQRRAHRDPLMFVELIPFGETKEYIKNVWRNLVVY